jgi:hypothetical protein
MDVSLGQSSFDHASVHPNPKDVIDAKPGSLLYCLAHVSNPGDDMVEVLILYMESNMSTGWSGIRPERLTALHQEAVDLLKNNLPDKVRA